MHLQILLSLALARLSGCACLKTLRYRIETDPLEIGRVSQHVLLVFAAVVRDMKSALTLMKRREDMALLVKLGKAPVKPDRPGRKHS